MPKKLRYTYLICALLCVAFYITCGLWAHFGVAQLWIWPLAACGLGVGFLSSFVRLPRFVRFGWRGLLCLGLAALIALTVPVLSHLGDRLPDGLDHVIVLGARVKQDGTPSLALRHRIDAAVAYHERSPETVLVLSGGQGDSEPVSEAACMAAELIKAGVPEALLVLEEGSSDTAENFANCRRLIPNGTAVGFITNNFHVCRSRLLAQSAGFESIASGACEFVGPLLVHYIVREALGLAAERLRAVI